MIYSIQKCSRQQKKRAGSRNDPEDIFVFVQVTHANGESAKRIRNKNLLNVQPNGQSEGGASHLTGLTTLLITPINPPSRGSTARTLEISHMINC